MLKLEIAVKIYVLAFFSLLMVWEVINLLTRKEWRRTQAEIWKEHLMFMAAMAAIAGFTAGLAWFLFRVI